MNNPSLTDDLAYVRDLAEAGQQSPLLGGRFLVWWGGLMTLAYAGHYLIVSDVLKVGDAAYGILWSVFGVVGLVGYFTLVKTMPADKPGQSSATNKVEASVWMIAGFSLFAYFITLTIKAFLGGDATAGFMGSLPLVFTAYAIGLFTSGAIARNTVLKAAGYGALGMIVVSTLFSDTLFIWAVAALGAFLTAFLPGLLMLMREPKSIV
ncbi:hypothetical protein RYZ27_13540 [Hyphomonas sp. FCG-A18]|uniref:hypothetical protein n=1 Tax=Hyphomonas sp. FCG-A18 TaxID=3080019 RepID=UPI002B2AFD92|nr:hypothetical protein RYZ27_13540 [Hyphomonas sp. FCG-A18]